MRVTFCSYNERDHVAGPDAWLQRLLPELRRRGIEGEVLLITGAPPSECPTVRWAAANGFKCSSIPRPRFTEEGVRWLVKKTAESRPDVFVANFILPAYFAGHWIRSAGIPIVGVMHSDEPYYHALIDEFVFGPADYRVNALVCVSEFLEEDVRLRNPQGIILRKIPCGTPIPSEVTRINGSPFRLAYVGRLVEEQKRISEVTRAMCRVTREVPDTEAVLYGDGLDRANVESILRTEGSGLPVRLEGRVPSDEIQRRLLACHALVLLSDYEGLPIAVMEAMACGVVPVCLRVRSGVTELVHHRKSGLLVDDRDDSFVAAIRELASSPNLWAALSRQARQTVVEAYSMAATADLWADLLRDLKVQSSAAGLPHVPLWVRLPPVNPRLVRHDRRFSVAGKAKGVAGKLMRKLLGG